MMAGVLSYQSVWGTSGWGSPVAVLMILGILLTFALIVVVLTMRANQKTQRLRLMEKALQAGSLDDETRRQLLDQLSGRSRRRPEWLSTLYQHLLFLSDHDRLGWLQRYPTSYFRNFRRSGPARAGTFSSVPDAVKIYQHLLFLSKHALFVIGWLGLFTGIGLLIVGIGFENRVLGVSGIITALVSFGVVTVPMALREVERRRA